MLTDKEWRCMGAFDTEIADLPIGLPFDLEAPDTTVIAFYHDGTDGLSIFTAHVKDGG